MTQQPLAQVAPEHLTWRQYERVMKFYTVFTTLCVILPEKYFYGFSEA